MRIINTSRRKRNRQAYIRWQLISNHYLTYTPMVSIVSANKKKCNRYIKKIWLLQFQAYATLLRQSPFLQEKWCWEFFWYCISSHFNWTSFWWTSAANMNLPSWFPMKKQVLNKWRRSLDYTPRRLNTMSRVAWTSIVAVEANGARVLTLLLSTITSKMFFKESDISCTTEPFFLVSCKFP